MNESSDTKLSPPRLNILKSLSPMIPGKLQYSINVALSNYCSLMAEGDKHLNDKSLNRSLKYGSRYSFTNLLSFVLSKSSTYI